VVVRKNRSVGKNLGSGATPLKLDWRRPLKLTDWVVLQFAKFISYMSSGSIVKIVGVTKFGRSAVSLQPLSNSRL